jgi:hypothetical protein
VLKDFINSNKDFFKFIGGNRGALKLNSNILFKIKSPEAKLFLKLFKSYSR